MFSYYWILRVLYIFWIQVFFLIRHDLQIFILICSWFFHPLHFLIINGRGFYFWLSIIYQFVLLWILLLLSYLRNLCLSQDHRDSPMYSSIKFKVLVLCIQPGHETTAQGWCTGMTQRDGMGREVGGGLRMGNTCKSMVDSCQCMAKTTTIL